MPAPKEQAPQKTLRQKDRLGFILILESGLDAANLPSPNPPKG